MIIMSLSTSLNITKCDWPAGFCAMFCYKTEFCSELVFYSHHLVIDKSWIFRPKPHVDYVYLKRGYYHEFGISV